MRTLIYIEKDICKKVDLPKKANCRVIKKYIIVPENKQKKVLNPRYLIMQQGI